MASRPPSTSSSEIPDLDLATPGKRRPAAPTEFTSLRPIPAKSSPYGIEGILDDDLLGSNFDGAPLDLDVSDSSRLAKAGSPPAPTREWPRGITPEVGSLPISPEQIEPLCSWGPRPTQFWQSIAYAYFVHVGRHQLFAQMQPISDELAKAEAHRDECLAALATRLKDSLSGEGCLDSKVEAVTAAYAVYGNLADQQQTTEANLSSETLAIDQTLLENQERLAEAEGDFLRVGRAYENAEISLKREQARLQRIGIKQRNVEQSILQGEQASARLQELQRQSESLLPQIEAAQVHVISISATLKQASLKIDRLKSQIWELQRRRSLQSRSLSNQLRRASKATESAIEEQKRALADLGRAILAANGRIAVDDATLNQLSRHDESVGTLWLRKQVYLQALSSFDRDAAKRGTAIIVTVLAAFVLAFVWKLIG